jgi:hypothetical protein
LNLTGIVFRFAYRLRRHLMAGWPLSRWLGLLLVVSGGATLISWWPNFWPALLLGILYLTYIAILAWAGRKKYIHFEAEPDADSLLNSVSSPPPLRTEEMVPVRASGQFAVEGQEQYYVDIEADFETVGTREHIVLGRLHASRFLLVGRWPIWELGWWYIFFQPTMIRELTVGHLARGAQSQLALRIVYALDEETQETIYLAFAEASTLRRVWDDLLLDAPAGVAAVKAAAT